MKIIKVKNCLKCPKRDWGALGSLAFCEEANKHIVDVNIIPNWCPLENYIELCKYKCSCGYYFEMKIQKVEERDGVRYEFFTCDNCGKKFQVINSISKAIKIKDGKK